jgi:hypothetical protein
MCPLIHCEPRILLDKPRAPSVHCKRYQSFHCSGVEVNLLTRGSLALAPNALAAAFRRIERSLAPAKCQRKGPW